MRKSIIAALLFLVIAGSASAQEPGWVITTAPPASEPLTIEEAKTHIRVTASDDTDTTTAGLFQPRPKPTHWYRDKKWWAGTVVNGLVLALDSHSTCRAFDHGGVETNFLLRGNRSCGVQIGAAVAEFAGITTLHALAWHCVQNEDTWHGFGKCYGLNQDNGTHQSAWHAVAYLAAPVATAAGHIPAAIHNYRLPNQ